MTHLKTDQRRKKRQQKQQKRKPSFALYLVAILAVGVVGLSALVLTEPQTPQELLVVVEHQYPTVVAEPKLDVPPTLHVVERIVIPDKQYVPLENSHLLQQIQGPQTQEFRIGSEIIAMPRTEEELQMQAQVFMLSLEALAKGQENSLIAASSDEALKNVRYTGAILLATRDKTLDVEFYKKVNATILALQKYTIDNYLTPDGLRLANAESVIAGLYALDALESDLLPEYQRVVLTAFESDIALQASQGAEVTIAKGKEIYETADEFVKNVRITTVDGQEKSLNQVGEDSWEAVEEVVEEVQEGIDDVTEAAKELESRTNAALTALEDGDRIYFGLRTTPVRWLLVAFKDLVAYKLGLPVGTTFVVVESETVFKTRKESGGEIEREIERCKLVVSPYHEGEATGLRLSTIILEPDWLAWFNAANADVNKPLCPHQVGDIIDDQIDIFTFSANRIQERKAAQGD
jgi:hypothetical protein